MLEVAVVSRLSFTSVATTAAVEREVVDANEVILQEIADGWIATAVDAASASLLNR